MFLILVSVSLVFMSLQLSRFRFGSLCVMCVYGVFLYFLVYCFRQWFFRPHAEHVIPYVGHIFLVGMYVATSFAPVVFY